ncbi:hypothetical protein NAV33_03125 [Pseudomonas stutzeri]|uniref:hypothetical protein n=1 Tax=Stutzerimonas stutzeri TaxID=316 RepID=UPI00210C4833|nr:hypothetical protein [Stutzerimonas stutzeri]MCQ4310893.1 hypothetical protein [Stutzerimonas stutzeri]
MTEQSKAERVRKQNAARQQSKRDRTLLHREKVGAEKIKFEIYSGTRRDLDAMQQVGGYTEAGEAITLAIRYMADMARRDPAAFAEAMNPRNPL